MTSRAINAPLESPAIENTWDLSGGVRIPTGYTQQQHDNRQAAPASSSSSFADPQSGARVAAKSCACKGTAPGRVTPRVVERVTTWNEAATTFFRSPSSLITFFILHGEILLFTALVARPGPRTVLCGVMGNVLMSLGVIFWADWLQWK